MDEYAEERKKNNEDQSYMIPRKEGHAANNEDQGYMIPRKEEDAAMEMKHVWRIEQWREILGPSPLPLSTQEIWSETRALIDQEFKEDTSDEEYKPEANHVESTNDLVYTRENGKTCIGDSCALVTVGKGGGNIQACQSTSVGGTETRLSFSGALSNMGSSSGGGGVDEEDKSSQRKLPEDEEVREANALDQLRCPKKPENPTIKSEEQVERIKFLIERDVNFEFSLKQANKIAEGMIRERKELAKEKEALKKRMLSASMQEKKILQEKLNDL
ncbi:hypothetical protein QYM36_016910 [Artemia franciscana]|uniref:Uncharacterized protein n=1 Tax=Artemia franciscana TaxID=6661 RepID=A0AA88L1Y8_ARTSF|nr:hypothetical protein QYM36_016910 [Artemia franciscana]